MGLLSTRPRQTGTVFPLLAGVGLGAALMYVFDPERGRRRRALARDKAVHAAHKAGDALGAKSRDLSNRARGLVAETRSALREPAGPPGPESTSGAGGPEAGRGIRNPTPER